MVVIWLLVWLLNGTPHFGLSDGNVWMVTLAIAALLDLRNAIRQVALSKRGR